MEVFYRDVNTEKHNDLPSMKLYEVKVEFKSLGVPSLRVLFAFANSADNTAATQFTAAMLIYIRQWLEAAFSLQIKNNAAMLIDALRNMGWAYVKEDELSDIDSYRRQHELLLKAQFENLAIEQSAVIRPVADRLSAYEQWYQSYDFSTEITDDGNVHDQE